MTYTLIQTTSGEKIAGILEQKQEIDPSRPRPRLILIAHGSLEHKDQLYYPLLAQKLPYSTFRFDYRGVGDSGGEARYANFTEDTEDLFDIASYFENEGYEIWAVIGHSRGSTSCFKYATTCDKPLAHVVNVSGRYDMNDDTSLGNLPENNKKLREQGYFLWSFSKKGSVVESRVTRKDVERYRKWNNAHVSHMPKATSVLTCHGLSDTVVPASHAAHFANAIPTHTLKLVPGASHDFVGQHKELVAIIVDYFEQHEKDAYVKAMAMGQHVSVCIPRWIDVKGVKNFRDIGGWPLKDGSGYIRERVVFRCGHLVNITEEGIDTLQGLNVTAAFDFRSDPEIDRQGMAPDIPGLTRYPSAMFSKGDYSPSALASRWKGYFEGPLGFPKVYNIILEKAKQQYRNIFTHMLKYHSDKSTMSLIVHCTAGKDRTGIFVMLLLGLCGVDEEIISHEYSLSNLGYWEPEEELEKKALLLGTTIENIRMVMSAPYLAMKATIQQVKERYGSIEGYVLNECGLTMEQVQGIRALMIIPIRFEERQLYRP